jgi:cold shock CspA family protein
MQLDVGIGVVKLFDSRNRRGIISQQPEPGQAATKGGRPEDVYFEVTGPEALKLREGQLVQFVMEKTQDMGLVAKDVRVLSDKA